MIIHNPEITGSLSFPKEDGTKVRIQLSTEGGLETVIADATGSVIGTPQSNFSGSFTGSFVGDGSLITGVAASSLNIDLFTAGTIAGDDEILFSDTDDSGTEKRGTFQGGLNSVGVVSGSSQIDVEQTTNFNTFSSSIASTFSGLSSDFGDLQNKPTLVSGSSQIEFNDINSTPFSQSGPDVIVDKNIVPSGSNITLGTAQAPFKDLYLSSASLYIDGQQVLSSNATELILTTDTNQSLKLLETGADTITLQSENGDITIVATGTGNIELNAPIQILAGKQILSSDGNAIVFGEDISVTGSISLTGNVDGVDVSGLKSDFDTLKGNTLVSGSSQVSFTTISDKPALVSGSSQIDVEQTTNFSAFSSSIASTFDGLSSNYVDLIGIPSGIVSGSSQVVYTSLSSIPSGIVSGSTQVTPLLPSGVVSGSSQIDLTATTNYSSGIKTRLDAENVHSGSYLGTSTTTNLAEGTNLYYTDTRVKTKLDAEGVTSGSTHILALVSIDEDTMSSNSDTKLPTQQSVKAYVDGEITALISGSPATLDTLNELAAALGDDPNFATTISTTIGGKVSQSFQIISGDGLTGGGNLTTNRTLAVGGTADRISVSADAVDIASTYVGQSTITTLGTIGTGTWAATDVAVAHGGTGASDGAGARTNLGLVIGTDVQAYNSTLAAVAGGTYSGDDSITTVGTISTGTWNGSVIASAYLDSDTAHLSGTQTFSGAKTFSAAVNITDSTASTTKTTGALKVTGGVGISGALNVGGDVVAYASSDRRLKDNIVNIENPIEKVQKLNGVTWDWNSNADELQQSLPNVGVIAQEVEEVFPQLVHDRDNGYKGVDYAKLTGLLIEAIKEQQKQIDELKSRLG